MEFVITMINRTKVKKLLLKLEEEPFAPNQQRGGEVEDKLVRGCVDFTRLQAMFCWLSVLVTVGIATVSTLIKRIKSNDPNDWEFNYGPITLLNVTHSVNYEITWLYQIVATSTIGVNHCTINLIIAGVLAHVSVQFQMLQNNLKRIVENAYRLMKEDLPNIDNLSTAEIPSNGEVDASEIPWKYLKQSFDAAHLYHLKIIDVAKETGQIFDFLMFAVFMFSLGVLCFLVYHASVLEANDIRLVKAMTDTVVAIFPVLLLCYWSQEVVFQSEQVAKAAFEANFVGSDLRFQKNLNMIVGRSQRPVQLKAGKLIEINLDTFVWIVRTSYSAFMVLRKVNTEQ